VSYSKADLRPAYWLFDVKGADLRHVKAPHAPNVSSFWLKDVEDFSLQQSPPLLDRRIERVRLERFE
jgi:hypothetical protein